MIAKIIFMKLSACHSYTQNKDMLRPYFFFILLIINLLLYKPMIASSEVSKITTQLTEKNETEPILYRDSYALIIGISNYSSGWPRLSGVKKDVLAVADALNNHGFKVVMVEDPTYSQLIGVFNDFINKYGHDLDNRLLFYFAGHGFTSKQSYGEEMGFIIPSDAPLPKDTYSGFLSKAVDMQQIEVFAKRIQSKHSIFIFDSCFSGSIFAQSRSVPENISYKTARPVRQFITSGSADEEVPDESIFRKLLISGLSGEADMNNDGYITGTELGEFLQDKVINYTKGAQHPQYGKIRNPKLDKGDTVFRVGGNATLSSENSEKGSSYQKWKSENERTDKEKTKSIMIPMPSF